MNNAKRGLGFAGVLLFFVTAQTVQAVQPANLHCFAHDQSTVAKVEGSGGTFEYESVTLTWSGDPGVLVIANNNAGNAFVSWCAKGGSGFSGGTYNTGIVETIVAPNSEVIVTFDQEVSYVVVYNVSVTGPSDTPSPTPSPSIPNDTDPSDNPVPRVPDTSMSPTIGVEGAMFILWLVFALACVLHWRSR